ASENGFTQHNVGEWNEAAEWSERVVGAVHGATTCVGGDGRPQGGIGNAEADVLALHVAARLQRAGVLINANEQRISPSLSPVSGGNANHKKDGHGRPHCPAVALRTSHPA